MKKVQDSTQPAGKRWISNFTIQLLGELLITAGVIVGLFAFWQVYIGDNLTGSEQTQYAQNFTTEPEATASASASATPAANAFKNFNKVKKQGDIFARMYVPRFDPKWERLVGEGTRWAVLNTIGVGHYTGTQFPGQEGNFAVAAHRGGFGGAFRNIDQLKAGDKVWFETNKGWFVYKYLQTKIVKPTAVGVIKKVPQGLTGAQKGGKYLTLTSCHPVWVNTHRIIAWFELEAVFPLEFGMPQELKDLRGE